MDEAELIQVLRTSLYPGAQEHSVRMVLGYCKAAGLDPMLKPVHIVPMWDRESGGMRDVVMPGIGMYRIQASRGGACAGISEPEFGPDTTESIGGLDVTYPLWCKVVAKRLLPGGVVAEFPAVERWKENYAVKGGKDKSIAPNAMWQRRPYGQLQKCAEAQALRKAFPEIGAQPTAEEMEGRALSDDTPYVDGTTGEIHQPSAKPYAGPARARVSDEERGLLSKIAAGLQKSYAAEGAMRAAKRLLDSALDSDQELAVWEMFSGDQHSTMRNDVKGAIQQLRNPQPDSTEQAQ